MLSISAVRKRFAVKRIGCIIQNIPIKIGKTNVWIGFVLLQVAVTYSS